jgi:hypothetical protein
MNRLKLFKAGLLDQIRHPEDVATLRRQIPDLNDLNDAQIQHLYSDWSEEYYSAGWLCVDVNSISEFERWLNGESEPEVDP